MKAPDPPPPPTPVSKKGDPKKDEATGSGGTGPKAAEKGAAPDPQPRPLPRPIARPQEEPAPLPRRGVTAKWPTSVLPIVRRSGGGGGNGSGDGGDAPIKVAQKTLADKVAEELAYAGAIANQQLNEDTKRPDGKQYGIPGGKDPNGPNNPLAQAAAGAVLVGAAVLSAGAGGFKKKLVAAIKKSEPLLYKEVAELSEEAAEELAKKYGYKIAHAMTVNGTIGPYSVMRKFTDNLGGKWQAHHILEVKMMKDFKLGKPDLGPSVLLTDAEHKAITAKLKLKTADAKTTKKLWQAYQDVYKDYPHWLKAIEPYFVKGK